MMDYREAGVDIAAADALIESIKPMAQATTRPGAMGMIGGFGALFDPKAAGFVDPLIVTSTDGVGTKLKVAIDANQHDDIGIDLVAMCVNDLICQGATPLSFLDYFATGQLTPAIPDKVISGIARGCLAANCVLAGGETAEMPGLYSPGHYDLAGFALGAVERDHQLPGDIRAGDEIIALASSGVHSNGFSLVRRIIYDHGVHWLAAAPFAENQSYADAFLIPTRIYVRPILEMHTRGLLTGVAHITGGGLLGNLPRIIPQGLRVVCDAPWSVPSVFGWLKHFGQITDGEMMRTFNCGVGIVLITRSEDIDQVFDIAFAHQEVPFYIGRVEEGLDHQIGMPAPSFWMR